MQAKRLSNFNITIFYSLVLIVSAQLNMSLFVQEFKISIVAICLPVLYFFSENFKIIPITFITAPGIMFFRTALDFLENDSISLLKYSPEMIFYLVYGLLFWALTQKVEFRNFSFQNLLWLILIDLFSNATEILLRTEIDLFTFQVILNIAIIAVGRTVLVGIFMGTLAMYGEFMLKKDERERYKNLLLLISKLNGELIWLKKNSAMIEETMAISYNLYNDLKKKNNDEQAAAALMIAKDVHEIKKEYRLIMKGLSEALEKDIDEKGMFFSEIMEIIQESTENSAKTLRKDAELKMICSFDFYTDKHYYLMSIFRNLLTNALEALEEGKANLELSVEKIGENVCFKVKDNCGGIDEDYIGAIFTPGFSTKFNEKTGEINRGLGLALVKDMVQKELRGEISVKSEEGKTEFTLNIPLNTLEKSK